MGLRPQTGTLQQFLQVNGRQRLFHVVDTLKIYPLFSQDPLDLAALRSCRLLVDDHLGSTLDFYLRRFHLVMMAEFIQRALKRFTRCTSFYKSRVAGEVVLSSGLLSTGGKGSSPLPLP